MLTKLLVVDSAKQLLGDVRLFDIPLVCLLLQVEDGVTMWSFTCWRKGEIERNPDLRAARALKELEGWPEEVYHRTLCPTTAVLRTLNICRSLETPKIPVVSLLKDFVTACRCAISRACRENGVMIVD